MSAIGSYVVMSRRKFHECLELARSIRSETTGKWVFKKTQVVGLEEFNGAWKQGVLKEVETTPLAALPPSLRKAFGFPF